MQKFGHSTGTTFRPKDVYVYGDTLYAVNDATTSTREVFGLAGGGLRVKEWKHGEATSSSRRTCNDNCSHEGSRTEFFLMRRAIEFLT